MNEKQVLLAKVKVKKEDCPDGKHNFKYYEDSDNGDWCEAQYVCLNCGKWKYVELPD